MKAVELCPTVECIGPALASQLFDYVARLWLRACHCVNRTPFTSSPFAPFARHFVRSISPAAFEPHA